MLGGTPLDLIRDGELCPDALRKERMNEQELWSALRLHGLDREELADVRRVQRRRDLAPRAPRQGNSP